MKRLLFIVLLFGIIPTGFAQGQKYEKETRIKKEKVPLRARTYLDSLHLDSKIRWFKETGLNRISYEAKTNYHGHIWSIEFSSEGVFEDIEIEVKRNEVADSSMIPIKQHLDSSYQRYSIHKLQIQYSGDSLAVNNFVNGEPPLPGLIVRYEIVVATKVNGTFTLFELLYSAKGNLLLRRRIIQKMNDNLEY